MTAHDEARKVLAAGTDRDFDESSGEWFIWCKECDESAKDNEAIVHVDGCRIGALAALLEEYDAQAKRLAAAERLCREVLASGVEFDDERIGYVAVQIDRVTWDELAALAREEDTR